MNSRTRNTILIGVLILSCPSLSFAEDTLPATKTELSTPTSLSYHELSSEPEETLSASALLISPEEATVLSRVFMDRIVASNVPYAMDAVGPYFPIRPSQRLKLQDDIAAQLEIAERGMGKPLGYVLVKQEAIGDLLVRLTFLERCQWDVIRWTLVFYRTPTTWVMTSVNFDVEIDGLFEDVETRN